MEELRRVVVDVDDVDPQPEDLVMPQRLDDDVNSDVALLGCPSRTAVMTTTTTMVERDAMMMMMMTMMRRGRRRRMAMVMMITLSGCPRIVQ